MKVFLHGRDKIGWSIDADRKYLKKFLIDIGHTITSNFITADVVHSVWWNALLNPKWFPLRFKRSVIATATNEIKINSKEFLKALKFVYLWIAPNKRQYNIFVENGINAAYQPFYVNEDIFCYKNKTKEEIALELGIDTKKIKNKIIIGSFQRDTLGSDLSTPKWQKGPDFLIKILKSLPNKDKWLLLLAGPRRHYIISECEKYGIPYLYFGKKPKPRIDDIRINTLDENKMALLYNLIDCYIVTSRSEGGPKAVLEASFCKTLIFSTNVGLAPDILDSRCIYKSIDEIRSNLIDMINGEKRVYFNKLIENNYKNVKKICSYDVIKKRWEDIYGSL